MRVDLNAVRAQARAEIEAEQMRLAVAAEKERLLRKKSLWQRLTQWLPFTITRRKK